MLVTHDLLDAVALGDRMVVIDDGGIVQTGTPAEVTARPRSRYVADLTGVNLLRGTARGKALDLDDGGQLVIGPPATGPTLAVVAPAAVSVSRQRPEGPAQNTWPGQIRAVDLMGDRVRVRIEGKPSITAEVPRPRSTSSSSTTEASCGLPSAQMPSRCTRHDHQGGARHEAQRA